MILDFPQSFSVMPLNSLAVRLGLYWGTSQTLSSLGIMSPFVLFAPFPFSCSLSKESFNPEASAVEAGWIQAVVLHGCVHSLLL